MTFILFIHIHFPRVKANLEPLEDQLATRKSELENFKSALVAKKNELADYNNQVEDVNKNLR